MVWSLFSCSKNYPEAELTAEEGFIDISFPITKHEVLPSGARRFHAKGKLQNETVGFVIELEPQWNPQIIEGHEDANFYWGEGAFCSSGKETDHFVAILSKQYEISSNTTIALQRINAEVVGLLTNPEYIDSERIPMKFFFNPGAKEDFYSEVFINIDLENKKLEFHEKDEEYRNPLIKSLTTLPDQSS